MRDGGGGTELQRYFMTPVSVPSTDGVRFSTLRSRLWPPAPHQIDYGTLVVTQSGGQAADGHEL